MSHIHITHEFLTERVKSDSWKMLNDFSHSSLWAFFFWKVAHFFIIKDKKNEEKCEMAWNHDFDSPLSLKSEVACDIAHWSYNPPSVSEPYVLVQGNYPSANKALFFLHYSLHCEYSY